jgi:hypothetical protein
MKEQRANPEDGPMQDRREVGEAKPERPAPRDLDNTPDHQGIEIDHERERPQGDDKLQ